MKPQINPLPKQYEAWLALWDKVIKYVTFGGAAGGGKSWLGCEWLVTNCYQYPGTKWFIAREELKRLMQSSYVSFKKVCEWHGIPETDWKLNGQYNYIEFKNKSRIDLLDVKELPADPLYERFGSLEFTGGWLEEAGEIKFRAFDVLKSRVGRHMNKEYDLPAKLLITCNPKKNWLKTKIYDKWVAGTLSEKYTFIRSLYSDNMYTADEYGENLSEIEDVQLRQRLKDGNWDYEEGEGVLIDFDAIVDLWDNPGNYGEKFITADVARFGKDSSVVLVWSGWRVTKILQWKNTDTATTAAKIDGIARKEGIPRNNIVVDEVGVGGGVLDNLKGAHGFVANATPLETKGTERKFVWKEGKKKLVTQKENYKMLKDQCGFRVAEKINNREVSIECKDERIREIIQDELACLKDAKPEEDVKKQLVSKDEIKEMINRSPDFLDAIVMRQYFELVGNKGGNRRRMAHAIPNN